VTVASTRQPIRTWEAKVGANTGHCKPVGLILRVGDKLHCLPIIRSGSESIKDVAELAQEFSIQPENERSASFFGGGQIQAKRGHSAVDTTQSVAKKRGMKPFLSSHNRILFAVVAFVATGNPQGV